jgi:hypothetical protein
MYCFCVYVYKPLPPGVYPIAVDKYINNLYDIYLIAVYTALDSSWWTENLSETCRVLFQKYILEISASRWFYYKYC